MGVKFKRTLGNRAYNIAQELNIPIVTAERVIKAYLNSLIESAQNGEDIVIDNIISIKLLKDSNGEVKARGRVSPAFKSRLNNSLDLTRGIEVKQ
jgi:ribosomal protein L22